MIIFKRLGGEYKKIMKKVEVKKEIADVWGQLRAHMDSPEIVQSLSAYLLFLERMVDRLE